jgi:hypothetical protein
MRDLADYILKFRDWEVPVSLPVSGDPIGPPSSAFAGGEGMRLSFGVPAGDVPEVTRHVGREARLFTNIQRPGVEVARLRLLRVNPRRALLVAELVRS